LKVRREKGIHYIDLLKRKGCTTSESVNFKWKGGAWSRIHSKYSFSMTKYMESYTEFKPHGPAEPSPHLALKSSEKPEKYSFF